MEVIVTASSPSALATSTAAISTFASLELRGAFGLPLELKDSLAFNLGLFLRGLEQVT